MKQKKRKKSAFKFFKLKKSFQISFNFLAGSIIIGLTSFIIFVSAAPLAAPYAPGATLTPECEPGDDNCTVYAPLTTSLTANTAMTMDNYALNFDSGTFYIDSANNRIGIGTTSPFAKLSVAGAGFFNEGVTASNLTATGTLTVTGQTTLGYASSTQFTTTGSAYLATTGGNVGIGTTNPATILNVVGSNTNLGTLELDSSAINEYAGLTLWTKATSKSSASRNWAIQNNYSVAGNLDIMRSTSNSGNPTTAIMSFDRSGNVGIGTTSPFTLLSVAGNGFFNGNLTGANLTATGTLAVQSTTATSTFSTGGLTVGTSQFVVQQTSGNVGIGTTNPGAPLHVQATAVTNTREPIFKGTVSDGGNSAFYIANGSGGDNLFMPSFGGLYATDNTRSSLTFNGYLSAANDTAGGGVGNSVIRFSAFRTSSATDPLNGTQSSITTRNLFGFAGVNGSQNPIEYMVVGPSGNVGIGTTSPFTLLSVAGNGFFNGNLTGANLTATGTLTVTGQTTLGYASSTQLTTTGSTYLATTNGNVGIGTTSPGSMLSIGNTGNDTINISATATSTFGSGLNLRTGCFAVNGVCVGGSGAGGSGTVGLGVTGQLPFYAADGTTLIATSSIFITSSGHVGIGTTTPSGLFHVKSNIPVSATGGTITYSGGYTIHTFTESGSFVPLGNMSVEYLVVGGGGGGAANSLNGGGRGGGGGGGVRTGTGYSVTAQVYTITVGGGGAGATGGNGNGSNGSDSVFGEIAAAGGGSGAASVQAGSGGSGGGGADCANPGSGNTPSVSPSQGNNGGNGNCALSGGAGGGGAGEVGHDASNNNGGNGGNGVVSSVSGSEVTYAGGGGGGGYNYSSPATDGTGGAGGGGNGKHDGGSASNGTANTGGGGGGGGGAAATNGGTGGSGIIIIRYLSSSAQNTVPFDSLTVNSQTGYVGIGTTSPDHTLTINGTVGFSSSLNTGTGGNYLCIDTTTYEVTRSNGSSCTASSIRFKDNIADIDYGLADILKLRPVSFSYKPELNMGNGTHLGFIAEEVARIIPELVSYNKNGEVQGLDYPIVTAVLTKAMQEQQGQINRLTESLASTSISSLLVKNIQELNLKAEALENSIQIMNSQGRAFFYGNGNSGASINREIDITSDNIILNGNIVIGINPFNSLYHETGFKLNVAGNINAQGLCLNGDCLTSWNELIAVFKNNSLQVNTAPNTKLGKMFALDADGYLTLDKINVQEIIINSLTMNNTGALGAKMIGQGMIEIGSTTTAIINKDIATSSKIFITWRETLNSADWWICDQVSEKSFSVCLDRPAAATTSFDYWIIGVKENASDSGMVAGMTEEINPAAPVETAPTGPSQPAPEEIAPAEATSTVSEITPSPEPTSEPEIIPSPSPEPTASPGVSPAEPTPESEAPASVIEEPAPVEQPAPVIESAPAAEVVAGE